jgi:hypothetical protein
VRKALEGEHRTRIGSVLTVLGFDVSQRSTRNERRVRDILQRLGWRRETKKDAQGNIWWVPPAHSVPDDSDDPDDKSIGFMAPDSL